MLRCEYVILMRACAMGFLGSWCVRIYHQISQLRETSIHPDVFLTLGAITYVFQGLITCIVTKINASVCFAFCRFLNVTMLDDGGNKPAVVYPCVG